MLVIDVSGSMQAKDVEPTRLAAAQKVVRDFMKGLPERFQVGVVSFSETAEVAAPATVDRQLAIDAIDYLYPQRGTAIGDGLARGVEVARAAEAGRTGQARPAAILLLRTARRPKGCSFRKRERRERSPSRSPSTRSLWERPRASSSSIASAARGSSPCRLTSRRCGRSPPRPAAASTRPKASATWRRVRQDGIAREPGERKQEVTFAFLAGGLVFLLAAAGDRSRDVPEAALRFLLALLVAAPRRLQRRRQGRRARLDGRADGHRHRADLDGDDRRVDAGPGGLARRRRRTRPSLGRERAHRDLRRRARRGLGLVLDRRGIILTNNHVVEGTTRVTVVFNDGVHKRPMAGTVIGTAPEKDLAVIRVRATDLVPLPLARSSSLRLGDAVFAVGFPPVSARR